ncbi:carcinoembryonic antigen-related cell adhesion molecule 2-like [Brachionichthys hirsutus]|uniref:carcinoembryonic antigen-related cell adhesion molecule 2-like n=1 Tax=Brachionichthys hirsutus TaxID=412623 RepID=UPI0036053856
MLLAGWAWSFVVAVNAVSELKVYRKLGDDVTLEPPSPVHGDIRSILWKHGPDLAVQWDKGWPDVDRYRQFKERSSLDTSAGTLTVTGLTLEDRGLYVPAINGLEDDPIHLVIISPVSAPTLSKSCDGETTGCVLTCDGATEDAGPITYRWSFGGKVLQLSAKRENISREEYSSVGEFSCELENPVSREGSQLIPNPFILERTVYRKLGDDVTLEPPSPVPGGIRSILWKHGPDLAVQWDKGLPDVDRYRQFKERGSLDTSAGTLTVTGLTLEDRGLYVPAINGLEDNPIHLVIISPVSAPTLSKSCDGETTGCVLTCDGATEDAGPITYRWRFGGKVLPLSAKRENISREEYSSVGKFSCELENPVSREGSQLIPNPFILGGQSAPSGGVNVSVGLTLLLCLLGAVLLGAVSHRWKTGMWFFQKDAMPWEAGFWSSSERRTTPSGESPGTAAVSPAEGDKLTTASQPAV